MRQFLICNTVFVLICADYVEYKNEKSIQSIFPSLNREKLGKVYFLDYVNRK